MESLPFTTSPETYSPEETAIRAWIKLNRETLAGRSCSEVVSLAALCGFAIADICTTLINFQDAMAGSSLENRTAFEGWRVAMAMKKFYELKRKLEKPELDLIPQWRELAAYMTTGEEFNPKETQ